MNNQHVGVGQQQQRPRTIERLDGGPIVTVEEIPPQQGKASGVRKWLGGKTSKSTMERVAFWLIAAAAVVVLLLAIGVFLPRIMSAALAGLYTGLFVGFLTLANLRVFSNWANKALGRSIFPVIQANDGGIIKLSALNAGMTFAFVFFLDFLASFIGLFFAGIIVFIGMLAAGIFYNRVRKVVIKP